MLGKVRLVALAASLTFASTFVGASSPASAAGCEYDDAFTSTIPRYSVPFSISSNSGCRDLNVVDTSRSSDRVRGQYLTSSNRWVNGSQGYVFVSTRDDGWDELILNVYNGTLVRGQTRYFDQDVRYAH